MVCADAYTAWQHHYVSDYHKRSAQFADISHRSDTGQLPLDKFYTELAAIAGTSPAKVERELDQSLKIDQLVMKIVREVRAQGLKAGLLSNSPKSLYVTIDEFGLRTQFDAILTSEEAGLTKPDPRIFVSIAARLGADPDEAIMVDDLESNARGAREAGLVGIKYSTPHSLRQELIEAGVPLD